MIYRNILIISFLFLSSCEQSQPTIKDNLAVPAVAPTSSNGIIDHVITSMAGGAAAGAAGGAAHAAVSHGLQRWQANRRFNRMKTYRSSRR